MNTKINIPPNSHIEKGLVSVLIPVFNRVNYIAETLESIYSQTYRNIEIIAIDDGSSDGSYEYLLSQKVAGKIQLLTHENRVNKGQAAALNLGLSSARGEYISILDSDDLFEPHKSQIQVEYLSENPDCGLVYGDGAAIDSDGKHLYDIKNKFNSDPNDPNEILLDCYFLLPQNSLVRRACYEKAGNFNESYRAAQDHDMLIRICEITNVSYIAEKVFKYRQHDGSISKNGLYNRWTNGFKILADAKRRHPYRSSTIRKRRAVLHFRMYEVYVSNGSKRNLIRGVSHLIFAGILDPTRGFRTLCGQ